MSSLHYSELCRLCLVNERVSIPIFDGESGIQSLCLKIGTCLPIKVSPEDILPKNICNDCFYKVENQYQFWISTANAEKQLLQWFSNSAPIPEADKGLAAMAADQSNFKTEMDLDPSSELSKSLSQVEAVLAGETNNVPDKEEEDEEDESEEEGSNSEDSDYDGENAEGDGAKDDGDTDEAYDEELEPTTFVNVSFECDEAGPSGTQPQQKQQQRAPTAPSTSTSAPAPSGSVESNTSGFGNLPSLFHVLANPGEVISEPLQNISTLSDFHVESNLYECDTDECRQTCISELDVTGHLSAQGDNAQFKCAECSETFSTSFKLSYHMKSHKERKFKCEICEKTFITQHHLKMHSSMHMEVKPYPCDICGNRFRYKKTFETHVKNHTKEMVARPSSDPFACAICDISFSNRNSYNHHTKNHNNTSNKCRVCGKTFSSKKSLVGHVRSHTAAGDKGFTCTVCGKELTSKESLHCHSMMHSGEKPLVCDVCGKGFSHRKYFVVHRRIHTGERPYSCVTCGKAFTQASTLTVHRRYHTGERPYKCVVCDKGFVTRTIMLTHMKKHNE